MVFLVVALVQGGMSDIMLDIIVQLKCVYKLVVKKKKKTIDKKSDQCNKRKYKGRRIDPNIYFYKLSRGKKYKN